ncbi:hypothetical protein LTR95_004441 [Oleoguttula sp. CCFEE 5521]
MLESPLSTLSRSPSPPLRMRSARAVTPSEATLRRDTSPMHDEPCSEAKLRRVTSQLFAESTPVSVFVLGEMMAYPVPKTLLASASDKLEAACEEGGNMLNLEVRYDTFKVFVGRLLQRSIFETRQSRLAEAWCLGQTWEIPEFQNAVMSVLVPRAQAAKIKAKAVRKAYSEVRPFLLKATFAMQFAFDWTEPGHEAWTTSLEKDGYPNTIEFFGDIITAMQMLAQLPLRPDWGIDLADYLVRDAMDTA